ncbi:DUF5313 family protein [Rhodococcus tibetensis]|uniref:DUF5313 domain-containing protein n=1 Tax=Rhodococcus tibetensis TaxID=2965064 RepID=A0ABT1QJQ8_9NOCA|nr:DUF5313 family protein [Rhodococcus sp. FXJ9.536]MCQ4122526.1 DUF5313 domain-containing protein [Rhodococcus sp. FXJ9.536]
MADPQRPSPTQYVGYLFGRTLPDSMQEWVRNDLVGPGASVRYVLRFMLPVVAVLLLFLLIPGPIWVPLAMMALLLLPLLYFAVALMNIYRRHRLLSHGLDPDLLTVKAQRRADWTREDYERRHGRGDE